MPKFSLTLSHATRREAVTFLKMLGPMAFILFVAFWFHDFVIDKVMANKAINIGIISAATYGVVLILMRLVSAQKDFRVIERFGQEAHKGVYMKTLLEEPWLKNRYVRHYLGHIAQTGGTLSSSLDQTAIENELHALSAEYDSRLELPQFLVGFMIAMGLLGTFIGLLETLTGISGMLDGMGAPGTNVEEQFTHLVGELRKPLAGMGTAFSASMFGLITSLMLAIMMTNLRRYIGRVIALARNVMHDLVEMKQASTTVTATPGMAMTFNPDLSPHAGGPQTNSNNLLASRLEVLTKKIEILLQSFDASIAGQQKLNDLLAFGPRMKETSEKTLEELKAISASHADQQRLTQSLIDLTGDIASASGGILDVQRQMKDSTAKSLDELRSISMAQSEQQRLAQNVVDANASTAKATESILDTQRQVKDFSAKMLEELRGISAGITDQKSLNYNLVDVGGNTVKIASHILEAQRQSQKELSAMLKMLVEKLAKAEEINVSGVRNLWEVKENFIKLCASLGVMELISTGIGEHTLLLETLVEETRTSQRSLNAIQSGLGGGAGQNELPVPL